VSRREAVSTRGLTRDTLFTADVFNDYLSGLRQGEIPHRLLRGATTALKGNPHAKAGNYGLLMRRFEGFPGKGQDTLVVVPLPKVPFNERNVTTQTMQWLEDYELDKSLEFVGSFMQGWAKGV
jgi:hypothetical protein